MPRTKTPMAPKRVPGHRIRGVLHLVSRQRHRLLSLKSPFLRILARMVETRRVSHPFFQVLHRLLDRHPVISLGKLLEEAGEQSLGLALLLLALLTFIPGVANVLSLVTLVLGIRMAWGSQRIWLPGMLRNRTLHRGPIKTLLARIEERIAWLASMRGPRRAPSPQATGVLVAWTALMAALPLPVLPFSNALPATALVLFGASLQEEWPALGWLGLAVTMGTTIYFGLSFHLALSAVRAVLSGFWN